MMNSLLRIIKNVFLILCLAQSQAYGNNETELEPTRVATLTLQSVENGNVLDHNDLLSSLRVSLGTFGSCILLAGMAMQFKGMINDRRNARPIGLDITFLLAQTVGWSLFFIPSAVAKDFTQGLSQGLLTFGSGLMLFMKIRYEHPFHHQEAQGIL